MLKVGLVLAECYANTCFAEAIAEGLGLDVKPHHTREMGRDKVLVKAVRALEGKLKDDEMELIVIDYERGPARKYIDENFERKGMYEGKVYIGAFRGNGRLVAIIFDPDIEEFLCKLTGRYRDERERDALKRGGLDRVREELRGIIKTKLSQVIDDVVNELREHYMR